MIINRITGLAAAALCGSLAACGPSEGFQRVPWDRAIEAQNQVDRLDALAATTERNMPDAGTASYSGSAIMVLGSDTLGGIGRTGIIADAALDVDFSGSGTVTGLIDNYEAVSGFGTDLQTRVPSSGQIVIGEDESLVGVSTTNNAWGADYRGTIDVEGTNYTVDGILVGGFVGNRVSDPTPAGITKGAVGSNLTLPTEFARTSSGGIVPFEISVVVENDR